MAGSDKAYGFCHRGTDNQLFVFEAAIDLLSFIQLFPKDWKKRIYDVKCSILEDNGADAEALRHSLKEEQTFYLNVMSSPGSGKTTVILETMKRLKDRFSIGVMEADIDSAVDARTILDAGFPAVQLRTGGMCHLDAEMSRQGMERLKAHMEKKPEAVILENVGNLVCPAEFDTGAVKNAVILSVPEGDDKPLKYPLIFQTCDVVLVTKIDAMEVFDFDFARFEKNVRERNETIRIFPVCALNGQGMDAWCDWLSEEIRAWKPKERGVLNDGRSSNH